MSHGAVYAARPDANAVIHIHDRVGVLPDGIGYGNLSARYPFRQFDDPGPHGTADPAQKERVGEEMADVLLYLLQLADHTGVDLRDAVERKLVKNAIKHPAPPADPASADGP